MFSKKIYQINGYVKSPYEPVKELFESFFKNDQDKNSQLCVWVNNECVIDLCGCQENEKYHADKISAIWSSGKSVAALLIAIMVDKNLLNYNEKICKYWPEFAKNNKENTTLADLMRHEAGLHKFCIQIDPEWLQVENIKQNKVGEIIENETQEYPIINQRRLYHAITRDLIANEIFRRVEPKGRTMGQYLNEEICGENGLIPNTDVYISVDKDKLDKCYDFKLWSITKFLLNSISFESSRLSCFHITELPLISFQTIFNYRKRKSKKQFQEIVFQEKHMGDYFLFNNSEIMKTGESPSHAVYASARGLAKLANILCNEGKIDDQKRILSENGWKLMHENPTYTEQTFLFQLHTSFSQGGVNFFGLNSIDQPSNLDYYLNKQREGYIGWLGLGGSIFQYDPILKIGFAYVPTDLNPLDVSNSRGKKLQHLVQQIVIKHKST